MMAAWKMLCMCSFKLYTCLFERIETIIQMEALT